MPIDPGVRKGRGAGSNPEGRFETRRTEAVDDGWPQELADELPPLATTLTAEHAKHVITRNDSPDIAFEQSINPYRGCEHGCVYCIWGGTEILMGNGATKAIADIRAGDEIYGTELRGQYRRYVKTQVLAHWRTRKTAYQVRLAEGTELIASADHRFLTERGWKFVAQPYAQRKSHLTNEDTLIGLCAARAAVCNCEPLGVQTQPCLDVVSVECLDERELFDITTGTGDFIANGVISHNCYARPAHAYMNLSPGLDFETRIFYKARAAELLEDELTRPGYVCKPLNLGANTDPYQPAERKLKVTRSLLEVLHRFRHPLTIVTKSALVERDIDILADMARDALVSVFVSITTLDSKLKRGLEPRAPAPSARLGAVRKLNEAGIPVGVLVAPIIPAVNDHEIEAILEASAQAGARTAGYVMLRLPHEVKDLFREWLTNHLPERADHVMSLIRAMRDGKDNDPRFGARMRGNGTFAELIRQRFQVCSRRLGLDQGRALQLSTRHFRSRAAAGGQLDLI
jgi:DNA repair photolyase